MGTKTDQDTVVNGLPFHCPHCGKDLRGNETREQLEWHRGKRCHAKHPKGTVLETQVANSTLIPAQ